MRLFVLKNFYNKLALVALVACLSGSLTSCFKETDVKQIGQQTGVLQVSPTEGPKNTIVNISGANFPDKSGITVKVNGKTIPVLASTGNSIQIQIPVGTGSGKIEVAFGGTTYDAGTFTYRNSYTLTALTSGEKGTTDGTLADAKFEDIESIAIDANDNLYVGNYYGTKLRKINLNTGTVSTVADQTGGAEFLSTDAAGNIYYVDEDNNQIVKVTPAGATTVLATPTFGIQGIKVGASGNIYVGGPSSIAKYSPAGTLLWRLRSHGTGSVDGDTSQVKFSTFGGIDVDPTETKIYFLQTKLSGVYPSQLKVLDLTAKTITTIAGTTAGGYANGAAADAAFSLIYGLALDKTGNVYLAENGNGTIRLLKDGEVSTVLGGNGFGDREGIGSAALLNGPQNVAFDSKGNMYIADFGSQKIYKVTID